MPEHYVYAYLRKSGTPYYIGKGKNDRAYRHSQGSIPTPRDRNRIVFLETNLTNIGACALERRYIRWYGRKDLGIGILHNRTDGGEGAAGIIPWNKGLPCSFSRKENISQATKGKKRSNETKILMSKNRKNKPQTTQRIEAVERQKSLKIFKWQHTTHGSYECSVWDLLKMFDNITKVGLRHVIYGFQTTHRGWSIKHEK